MKRITDKESAHRRLLEARELLMKKGQFHTDTEFARLIGKTPSDISDALHANPRKLTAGLLTRIADAFPDIINPDYLLNGNGQLEKTNPQGAPLYDVDFALGYSEFTDNVTAPDSYIELPNINAHLWCRATGDSMAPTIPDGALVALQRLDPPTLNDIRNNRIYAIVTADGTRTIKRLRHSPPRPGYIRLIPDNPDYESRTIRLDHILHLYRVVATIVRFH